MKSLGILAAALFATGGLFVSAPAGAAPKDRAVAATADAVILVDQRGEYRRDWRDRRGEDEKWREREGDRRAQRGDGRRDDWRDGRRDHRRDWREDRRDHRRDWREDRRDHRRDWREGDRRRDWDRRWDGDRDRHRHWDGDRHRHYGWDRGKHYGWDKRDHKRWRAHHHPRHRHWIGRPVPRVEYVVVHNYYDYYLPPPRYGHYYVRHGNDVYLIAEATKRIIDAFVLLDAAARY